MLDSTNEPSISVLVVYNPLEPDQATHAELLWREGLVLADYLEGLPEEVTWGVVHNFMLVMPEDFAKIVPQPGDHLIIAPIPEGGGDDGKSILALVATIALSIFAPIIGANLGAAMGFGEFGIKMLTAAVSIAGGLLINALLPPPSQGENTTDSPTYGIDGPKNTSTEGIPVPVLYGRMGFGGNYLDLYTENATDDKGYSIQYLYGRVLVSEGPIDAIEEVLINEQPVSSYEDVEIDYRLGAASQSISPWFNETVSLFNQGRQLTENFQTYTTSGVVDKLRMDFVCPLGMYSLGNNNAKSAKTVNLEIEYRKVGDVSWAAFTSEGIWRDRASQSELSTNFQIPFTYTYPGAMDFGNLSLWLPAEGTGTVQLQYRAVGNPVWIDGPLRTVSIPIAPANVQHTSTSSFEIYNLANDAYEFRTVVVSGTGSVSQGNVRVNSGTSAVIKITDKKSTQVRRTFKTGIIEQAQYEIRYRRTTPEGDVENNVFDRVDLADVGEIIADQTSLPYTAWVGFKIKLTGQLSGIPQLTGVARGRIVPIYDYNGDIVQFAWSDNPADIRADIYMNRRYGGQTEGERIDWASHSEWRDACTANGWMFNGIFNEASNIDEAAKHVYIAGRAQRISSGAKVSVTVDQAKTPVMMFGAGNIVKDSFEIHYMPFEDRINDFEVSFHDETDLYKIKTTRVVNEQALARGEPLKSSQIMLKGITEIAEAEKHARLLRNYNLLISRFAQWRSPAEAMGCTVGDVVLVQHEMPKWNKGGRLAAGSTTSVLQLDQPVTFETGESYRVLLHSNSRQVHGGSITAQSSNLVTISGAVVNRPEAHSLIIGGEEYAVMRIIPGVSSSDLVLETRAGLASLNGLTAQLWIGDNIEEHVVTNPAAGTDVEATAITLTTPALSAPAIYTNFMFGKVGEIRKEFLVTQLSRENSGEVEIFATEYNENVYDTDFVPPAVIPRPSGTQHVTNLRVEENLISIGSGFSTQLLVSWSAPSTGLYFGARVLVSINDAPWDVAAETNALSAILEAQAGDVVAIRVTARLEDGTYLPLGGAPGVSITVLGASNRIPSTPTGWVGVAGIDTISLTGNPSPDVDFKEFVIYGSELSPENYVELARVTGTSYVRRINPGDLIENYQISAVNAFGNEGGRTATINIRPTGVRQTDLSQEVDERIDSAFSLATEVRNEVSALDDKAESIRIDHDQLEDFVLNLQGNIDGGYAQILDFQFDQNSAFGFLLTQLQVQADGTSALIQSQQSALADIQGNASSVYVLRAKAGGNAAEFELVAWDDATGGGSVVRLSADLIIAEGTLSTDRLLVGTGNNLLSNSTFVKGLTSVVGTDEGGAGAQTVVTLRAPGFSWSGSTYPVLQVFQAGSTFAGSFRVEMHESLGDQSLQKGVVCKAGDWIGVSAYVSTHRCTGDIGIIWYDALGVSLGETTGTTIPQLASSATNPDEWPRYFNLGQAPANTAFAALRVRKFGTLTGSDSFLLVHKAMLEISHQNATLPGPYDAGGSTYIDGDQIVSNSIVGRHIVAKSISADSIGTGSLSSNFITVDTSLKIEAGGHLRVNKTSVNDESTDGIYMGADGTGKFGFALGVKDVNGLLQQIKGTENGVEMINVEHYRDLTVGSAFTNVTTSQTVILPPGLELELEGIGGGGGGGGGAGAGQPGQATIIELFDGAVSQGVVLTASGGSGRAGGTFVYIAKGQNSPFGNGGAGGREPTTNNENGTNAGPATGYGAGGGGAGFAGIYVTGIRIDISGLVDPRIVVTCGAFGAGGSGSSYQPSGGRGSAGLARWRINNLQRVRADVVPLAPTAQGTFSNPGSAFSFPDLGSGFWIVWNNGGAGSGMNIGNLEVTTAGDILAFGSSSTITTFVSDKTPYAPSPTGSATIAYRFYKMG